MISKKVSFASALVCAAFVPQAMGVCASGNVKGSVESATKKHEGYLDKKKNVAVPEGGEADDDEDFVFNFQTKRGTTGRNGIVSKIFDRASSFGKRYKKLANLLKKGALCGALSYGVVNFTPSIVDAFSKGSTLDSRLIPNGADLSVSRLMRNPNVDLYFLLVGDDGEEINDQVKKESVSDIADFFSAFVKMYKETGGNINVKEFKSSLDVNFDDKKDRERMYRFCKNLRSLPCKSIAENLGLSGNIDNIARLLEHTSVGEYQRVYASLNEAEKGEYHGFGNGGQDLKRDIKNMWEGGKKAVMDVGGETLGSMGSSLTMALPGSYKAIGVIVTFIGSLFKYFSNEEKMKDQKNLRG